jgi:hypothetical protein
LKRSAAFRRLPLHRLKAALRHISNAFSHMKIGKGIFVEGDPSTPPLFLRQNADWYQFSVLGSRFSVLGSRFSVLSPEDRYDE